MDALELVRLRALMDRTLGRAEVTIGLIDGPVALQHPDLAGTRIKAISDRATSACSNPNSTACAHGTAVFRLALLQSGLTALRGKSWGSRNPIDVRFSV
jgi:hypothetical protein